MHTTHRTKLLVIFCASILSRVFAVQASTPDFSGVWMIQRQIETLHSRDGGDVPLTDWGQRRYDENRQRRAQGDVAYDLTMSRCAAPGTVRMMTLSYPMEIFQRPFQVTLLFQWNHLYRLINVRPVAKQAPFPMAIGISNGEWKGRELIVHTTSMTDTTILDSSGLPHSDQLEVTEQFSLKGRDELRDVMTLHDPKAFRHDWSTELAYKKSTAPLAEDICLDRVDAGLPVFP
jgi:hypothetical protein